MEEMVRSIIQDYPRLTHEEIVFERHLDARENPEIRDALKRIRLKITMIEIWLDFLDADERYAFKRILRYEQKDSKAQEAANTTWSRHILRTGKTPLQIEEQAIKKVSVFATMHREVFDAIFIDC